ncbi:MAG: hypothetical protein HGA87_01095 [Desulfobulbaceae bacterium]|nr:hypothetical protein [Desulfobulbaceae bacterium]
MKCPACDTAMKEISRGYKVFLYCPKCGLEKETDL